MKEEGTLKNEEKGEGVCVGLILNREPSHFLSHDLSSCNLSLDLYHRKGTEPWRAQALYFLTSRPPTILTAT